MHMMLQKPWKEISSESRLFSAKFAAGLIAYDQIYGYATAGCASLAPGREHRKGRGRIV